MITSEQDPRGYPKGAQGAGREPKGVQGGGERFEETTKEQLQIH